MFELGMRITFNKPVIAITDDFETLPFDTKIIEHLKYPRDLHIHDTNKFISDLSKKIKLLDERFREGKYRTPLDALGPFEVFKPTTEEVPAEKYIVDGIDALMKRMSVLERSIRRGRVNAHSRSAYSQNEPATVTITLRAAQPIEEHHVDELIRVLDGVQSISFGGNQNTVNIEARGRTPDQILNEMPTSLGDLKIESISVD
jgi:hypothetical protein